MGIRKVVPIEEYGKKASPKNSKSTLKKTHTEEIIISLIGQIGTNVGVVRDALLKILQVLFGFFSFEIKSNATNLDEVLLFGKLMDVDTLITTQSCCDIIVWYKVEQSNLCTIAFWN